VVRSRPWVPMDGDFPSVLVNVKEEHADRVGGSRQPGRVSRKTDCDHDPGEGCHVRFSRAILVQEKPLAGNLELPRSTADLAVARPQ